MEDVAMTNDNIVPLPTAEEIENEASLWLMRLSDGAVSDEHRAEFASWINQSLQHKEAFERLSQFWDNLEFTSHYLDYAVSGRAVEAKGDARPESATTMYRQILTGAIAASILATIGFLTVQFYSPEDSFDIAYQTRIGQQQTVDLPDGSQVLLNTDSAMRVELAENARTIWLTKGEAFFDVAPDKDAPFSVRTDKGTVTAVGTAFSVRVHDDKLDVIVTEGRVALASLSEIDRAPRAEEILRTGDSLAEGKASPAVEVTAGQSAVIDRGVKAIAYVEPDQIETSLDWQDGVLSFRGETLEQVVEELARYSAMKIEISDPELRQQQVVAYYTIGDVDRMLEALNVMADIEVERVSEEHIKLYRTE